MNSKSITIKFAKQGYFDINKLSNEQYVKSLCIVLGGYNQYGRKNISGNDNSLEFINKQIDIIYNALHDIKMHISQ